MTDLSELARGVISVLGFSEGYVPQWTRRQKRSLTEPRTN
jgi:hypothetical protein